MLDAERVSDLDQFVLEPVKFQIALAVIASDRALSAYDITYRVEEIENRLMEQYWVRKMTDEERELRRLSNV